MTVQKKKKVYSKYEDEGDPVLWNDTDEYAESFMEATTFKAGRNFGKGWWSMEKKRMNEWMGVRLSLSLSLYP